MSNDELRDDLAVVARRLLGHMRNGDRLRLLEISKRDTPPVPQPATVGRER